MNPFAILYAERFTREAWGNGWLDGNKAGPPFAEPGVVLSPVKLRVLAMLAPKRGLRVAPVPSLRDEFDRACARLPEEWQVGTKEQAL